MNLFRKITFTRASAILIILVVLSKILYLQDWKSETYIFESDVKGYYAYLPALFIHNDLKFDDLSVYQTEDNNMRVWVRENEEGTKHIKYTAGMAMMYAPFFLSAHAFAESLGAPADGFSWPYRVALIIASLCYMVLGIIFLSTVLRRYYSDLTVGLTLIVLFLGTNLFFYETRQLTYSHGYSFMLLSLFMYASSRWLDAQKLKWAIIMGVASGLLVLIRPVDILFLPFALLLGVGNLSDLKARWRLLWQNRSHILVYAMCVCLMLVPQLLYFKFISGSYFFYSYTDEGFFFFNPHLYDTLFSFRNGWLIYSPLMVFSVVGFILLFKNYKYLRWVAIAIPLMYFYVISSWWCWWYFGFGNRAFINLYPLLALPLAALISFVFQRKWWLKGMFVLVVVAGVGLNIFQSYQFENYILHWGHMTKRAYVDAWGRTEPSQLQSLYFDVVDNDAAVKGVNRVSRLNMHTISHNLNDYESVSSTDSLSFPFLQQNTAYSGKSAMYFPENTAFMYNQQLVAPPNATHVKVCFKIHGEGNVFAVVEGVEQPFYWLSKDVYAIDKGWRQLDLLTELPPHESPLPVKFYVWNEGMQAICIDDFEVDFVRFTQTWIEN